MKKVNHNVGIIFILLLVLVTLAAGCGHKNNTSTNNSVYQQPSDNINPNGAGNSTGQPSGETDHNGNFRGQPESGPQSDRNNPGYQKVIEDSVTAGIITQQTADKIEAYQKKQETERKEEMEKNKNSSDDQKNEPPKRMRRSNPIDTWLEEGLISQKQADQMKKLMPEAPNRNPDQDNTNDQNANI